MNRFSEIGIPKAVFKFKGGGGNDFSDESDCHWDDEEVGLNVNAKFHDDTSDDTSMYSQDNDFDDDQIRAVKKKRKALLDVKREITYTAYGDNLETSIKLLTVSKSVKLSEEN